MPKIGVDFLIYIVDGATETKIGGQRGGTVNMSSDIIDVTTKDDERWIKNEYSFAEWSIDTDGLIIEDDTAFGLLREAFIAKDKITVRMITEDENVWEGLSLIEEIDLDVPYDGEATYSISLIGDGPLAYNPT